VDVTHTIAKTIAAALFAFLATNIAVAASAQPVALEQTQQLSAFGERPAFSPDARRVAFLDKAYGNAFEIELATGRVRNLTGHLPHQGIVRIQYLENGDYLISAPRLHVGVNSRINLELFVLDRRLRGGLQPLDQRVFEGVAVGPNNMLVWQQLPAGRTLGANESWMMAFVREPFEHYIGRVAYEGGRPHIVDRRLITPTTPEGCGFWEVQDFRDHGNEVLYTCAGVGPGVAPGPRRMGVFGANLSTGALITYIPLGARYVEVEGVAPDGAWATVECSDADGGLPALDICRLQLVPNGPVTPLIVGTQPGTPRGISNSVISPDGRWAAFQRSDVGAGEPGAGQGVYLARVAP
jgi:hypothetical protein